MNIYSCDTGGPWKTTSLRRSESRLELTPYFVWTAPDRARPDELVLTFRRWDVMPGGRLLGGRSLVNSSWAVWAKSMGNAPSVIPAHEPTGRPTVNSLGSKLKHTKSYKIKLPKVKTVPTTLNSFGLKSIASCATRRRSKSHAFSCVERRCASLRGLHRPSPERWERQNMRCLHPPWGSSGFRQRHETGSYTEDTEPH